MKGFLTLDTYIKKLYESGGAFDNIRPIDQEEAKKVFEYVQKNIFPILGLEGEGIDTAVVGSFGKKFKDQTSGDIDIAISVDKVASENNCSVNDVFSVVDSLISKAGYNTKPMKGFNQVCIAVAIPGTNDYAQVDLMLSTSLEWSKFMYYSPDFTKAESKYKGLYRNLLLMSIISEMNKEIVKRTEDDEIEEYKQFVIRLNKGVYSVAKSFMGKRGNLVKTAKLLKDQDKFIADTPEEVVRLAFGKNTVPKDVMTFESIWALINSNDFVHKHKIKDILEKYKHYLVTSKVPFPTEAVEEFPNIFK